MSTGKIVLGVLAGIAAGAALGVLIAPDKGANTRRKIKQSGADLADDLKENVTSVVDNITHKFTRYKGAVKENLDHGVARVSDEISTM
jgi:gas vesicle protein